MPIYSDLDESKITAVLLVDIQCIYQSINNIVNTVKGERLFKPEFGVDLESLLFELINDLTAFSIFSEMTAGVVIWEPRILIAFGQSSITPDPANFKYDGVVAFQVKNLTNQIFQYIATVTQ